MRYIVLFFISISLFASSAQELYQKALKYEEVDADFIKAKQLYSKIIAEYVTQQEYVARSMYHIAFISEMYAQKEAALNYYKMIVSKYSQFKGIKYLASSGIARLSKNVKSCAPAPQKELNTPKHSAPKTVSNSPSQEKKSPFDNDKYRHGKTAPLYIMNIGEKIVLNFDSIKGLGASDPSVADIEPTTSTVTITAKKVGFTEIMIKEANGKENYININIVDAINNKINNLYLIKGENKEIMIKNLEKIAVDNDILDLSAKDNKISLKAKKEGKITLTLMKRDGTKVDIYLKVLKPYDKTRFMYLKPLETKEVKFDEISSITITNHGIVDVKQEGKTVKITATSKGKTIVIIYGKDGAQLKINAEVN